jgi:hypothetical protein
MTNDEIRIKDPERTQTVMERLVGGSEQLLNDKFQAIVDSFKAIQERLVQAFLQKDDSIAKGLIPWSLPLHDIRVHYSTNGVYLVQIGCNIWAFTKPEEVGFLTTLYLGDPMMVERMVSRGRRDENPTT